MLKKSPDEQPPAKKRLIDSISRSSESTESTSGSGKHSELLKIIENGDDNKFSDFIDKPLSTFISEKDGLLEYPLHLIVARRRIFMLSKLLEKISKFPEEDFSMCFNNKGDAKESPLVSLLSNDNLENSKMVFLLTHYPGTNVNLAYQKIRPLDYAIENKDINSMMIILSRGPTTKDYSTRKKGNGEIIYSPLVAAVMSGDLEITALLLCLFENVKDLSRYGKKYESNPLEIAIDNKNNKMVYILLADFYSHRTRQDSGKEKKSPIKKTYINNALKKADKNSDIGRLSELLLSDNDARKAPLINCFNHFLKSMKEKSKKYKEEFYETLKELQEKLSKSFKFEENEFASLTNKSQAFLEKAKEINEDLCKKISKLCEDCSQSEVCPILTQAISNVKVSNTPLRDSTQNASINYFNNSTLSHCNININDR